MFILLFIILGVSFLLYTLLGGADFGAGILEMFAGRRGERIIAPDEVSPMPGLQYSFYVITVVYVLLSMILVWLMRRQIKSLPEFYPTAKL